MKEKECACPIFRALEKEGLRWNPETEEIEPIRWRARKGELYYLLDVIGGNFRVIRMKEDFKEFDNNHWESGNYFRTTDEAQKYADEFRRMLKERTLDKEE